jgi:hypothetical protein
MARIRSIKPEFFTSLTIADLTSEQRLTFIGLWTHADDEGRCVDDPRLIKAALWPLDDRTAADVETDLVALTESSLIARYTLNQRRYLAVSEDSLAERKGTGKGKEQGTGKGTPPPAARTLTDPGPAFDEFWSCYPRKAGKSEAAKAWIKATQAGADPGSLLAAVKGHADYHRAAKTEQQFIPHASTWLNQRRFEDDLPRLPRQAGPPPAPRTMTDEEKKNALKFG